MAWENFGINDSHDESVAPHAALAAQMESQQMEISSLRDEIAAQANARNAEAMAAEQAAFEKVKAQELRVSGAVDFLLKSGSGPRRRAGGAKERRARGATDGTRKEEDEERAAAARDFPAELRR